MQATQVAGTQQVAVTQTLGAQAQAANATNAAAQAMATQAAQAQQGQMTQTAQAAQGLMTLTAIADSNATSIVQTVSAIATQTAQAVSPTPPILILSPFVVATIPPLVFDPGIIVLLPTNTPTPGGFVINPGLIQVNPAFRVNPGIIALLPTPTPCPGFLTTRLTVGGQGRVLTDPPFPNNVRSAADSDAPLIGQIPAGATFNVVEGPVCNDNSAWYRVQYGTLMGWTAEGVEDDYFVEPVS
jgi:hypothetical protein